jgi:uncharacterized membrane protein YkgB
MNTTPVPLVTGSSSLSALQHRMEAIAVQISRYGLVSALVLIGGLKFTHGEAMGIQPLVAHSPVMSWLYSVLSVQGTSNLIGATEITIALMMAARPLSPAVSFAGSLGGVLTFLITVSFLFSTPGTMSWIHGMPALGDAGQFLIKDIGLLGSSLGTAAESLKHISRRG